MRRRTAPTSFASVVRCSCSSAEQVGDAVYQSGDEVDGVIPVRRASCEDSEKMPAIGIVISKPDAVECYVRRIGLVRGLFSGLESGKTYKVGVNGTLSRLAPSVGPLGYSHVQFLGVAQSPDSLYVDPEFKQTVRRG